MGEVEWEDGYFDVLALMVVFSTGYVLEGGVFIEKMS